MISLFEPMDLGRNEMPIDLMTRGARAVSLLQFSTLEEEAEAQAATDRAQRHAEVAPEFEANARAMQVAAMIDAAREDAVRLARIEFEHELAERLQQERVRAQTVCLEFAADRQRYFAAAESQVVKLAVAIARRVLAREVATGAMHLEATVRAALARVHEESATVLRVRQDESVLWLELFSQEGDGRVEVVGDERLAAGECVLETEVGRVELGVEAQLAEIERGFADLMQRRGE